MQGVAGWFVGRGEVPLSPPPRLREYVPLSDDPDRPGADFSFGAIRGVAFAMEYCDARGWASTRTVRCLGLEPRPPTSIKAYCHASAATRSFRVDRIISIVDLRTGAILHAGAHVDLLAPYLRDHDHDGRIGEMRALHHATRDGVFALLQLSMPDGRLGDAPREMVLGYVQAEAAVTNCPLPQAALVELWIDNLAPPLEAVADAVERLLGEKDKFARLLPWLLKITRSRQAFADQEESVRDLIAEVRSHFRRKLMDWPARSMTRLPYAG